MTAGIGNMLFRVLARFVSNAQFNWIEIKFFGELVHGTFECHQPDRLAGSAHRRCNRNVQRRQTMACQPIGSSIERAGLECGALIGLLTGQIAGEHIVADREDAALTIRGQPEALDRVGAVCRDVKYLLPRQRDFYRSLELPGGNRRQDSIRVDPELAAEPAADERTYQAYVLSGNLE